MSSPGSSITPSGYAWAARRPRAKMASRHANLDTSLFGRAQLLLLRRCGLRLGRPRCGEAGDQPRAEQRYRLVAEILGMGGQIIAVAFVEPEVEGLRQAPGLDLFVKEKRIEESEPVAAHRILRGQLLGVEHQTAIDREIGASDRTHEHFPEKMARPPVDLEMQEIVGGDQLGRIAGVHRFEKP